MSINSSSWRGSSLPPFHPRNRMDSNLSENRGRSLTDVSSVLAPKYPEPFLSIPAQVLVQDNCRVHCGMVRKENRFNKWQDRYLVLHKGCLYYYKDSMDKTAQGQFSLSGYRLSTAPEKTKYQWTFKLTHIQPEKRKYFFSAHSEKELTEWLDKIAEDVKEYCEAVGTKPGYSSEPLQESYNSSGSGGSCSSIASGGEDYDYPLVDPPNFNQIREQMRQNSQIARDLAGNSSESDPTYCPPPPEFLQNLNSSIASVTSRTVTEHKNVTIITGGKASVDVSTILKRKDTIREGEPLPPTPPKPAPRVRTLPSRTPVSCTSEVRLDERPQVPPRPTPPKPLPRPPTAGVGPSPVSSATLSEEFDYESDYLPIIANDDDQPMPQPNRTMLERMRPEGNSFKERFTETAPCLAELLPDSAYRTDYDKTDAIPLLLGKEGVYMIHSSTRAETKKALSVCVGDKVKHFILFRNKEGYALDPYGPRFKNKRNLLDYYHENSLPNQDSSRLKQPYK
ncbi:SH3 domain-binding protein 2-like [Actinia tenebrosa]|uniref:SH3 domain-binding protein 2-like n=1 Tax=Actinia tenebrosa TaxID=6105 RepID=A0A6P8ICX4_ACTTE|nr:SH3 domain-binding protein 2-like [Actinia tenebrosa]